MTDYTLIRSDRKTLALEVKSDGVLLARAPRRMAKKEIDAFVASKEAWILSARKKAAARTEAPIQKPLSPKEAEELLFRAKELLAKRIPYWTEKTGLSPSGVRITNAAKRFGSCSSKNSLCFSLRLFRYPDALIDYVILHEIAHIRHHNHSKAFYDLLASHMPDHRERQNRLRGNGSAED